jgi:hypothetical protein
MRTQIVIASGILLAAFGTTAVSVPAHALSMKECSAKYKAAQTAGTLNGMKWKDFRKSECGAQASAAPAAGASPSASNAMTAPAPSRSAPSRAPAVTGNAVFPSAVSPKYSKDSPGKARMETCLEQYHANKASNGNAGLKWIQKGGGYYSECNKRLKGA